MDELLRISDNITVMRDGEYIGTVPREKADIDGLIKMMVGREMKDIYPKKDYLTGNETILKVESLSKKDYFQDVSFDVKKGEIVGFFGLVGAGRSDVAKAIFGVASLDNGEIFINDKKVKIKK